jgi:hypothetical protein
MKELKEFLNEGKMFLQEIQSADCHTYELW